MRMRWLILAALTPVVAMSACRIPEDHTTPGTAASTPSITSVAVVQALASGAPTSVSDVLITHKGETILHGAIRPPAPASPPPIQTGEIDPGSYTIKVASSACPASGCERVKADARKPDCSVTVIIAKNETVTATVHVTKKACSIEVG